MKIQVFLLDADGCVYNYKYFQLIAAIANKYGDFFRAHLINPARTNEEVLAMQDEIKKIINDIETMPFDYDGKLHPFFKSLYDKNFDAYSNYASPESRDFNMNVLHLTYVDFVNLMESISSEILIAILHRANEALFSFFSKTLEEQECDHVLLAVGSNRMSSYYDHIAREQNGTGSIYTDIHHIQNNLQNKFPDKTIRVSPFSMKDVWVDLERGHGFKETIEKQDDIEFNDPDCVFDHTKGSLLYAFNHDITLNFMNDLKLPANKVKQEEAEIHIAFLDDSFKILGANIKMYDKHHALLTRKTVSSFYNYSGNEIGDPLAVIKGTGNIDYYSRENVKLIAKLCGHDLKTYSKGINMAYELDFNAFNEQRIRGPLTYQYKKNPSLLFSRESKISEGKLHYTPHCANIRLNG